jgi:hypothetical protein
MLEKQNAQAMADAFMKEEAFRLPEVLTTDKFE